MGEPSRGCEAGPRQSGPPALIEEGSTTLAKSLVAKRTYSRAEGP